VVVVMLGGTVVGGVLIGRGRVVEVVGGGTVVMVGGVRCTGTVEVVVGGVRCTGMVEVVVGTLEVVVDVDGERWRPGREDDGAVPSEDGVCLLGWGWATAGTPNAWAGPRVEALPAGASDRDELGVYESSSPASGVTTGTPAPVVRLGISGRVAPT